MPASAGIVAVSISAPKRGVAGLDAEDLDGGRGDLERAGLAPERRAAARGSAAAAIRSMPSARAHREALDAVDRELLAGVLGQRGRAGELGAARPDQREDRPLLADVLDLDLAPDLVHLEVAPGRRQRLGLGVDPDLARRPGRSTRMSACMWPLRSSSAA